MTTGLLGGDQCSDCDRTRSALSAGRMTLKRCISCNRFVCQECNAHHWRSARTWRGAIPFNCGHQPIIVVMEPAEPPIESGMHLGCATCGQKAVLRPGRAERVSDLVECLNCQGEMLLYGPQVRG